MTKSVATSLGDSNPQRFQIPQYKINIVNILKEVNPGK